MSDWVLCVIVKPGNAKEMRCNLFKLGIIDKSKKSIKYGGDVVIPVTEEAFQHFSPATASVDKDNIHFADDSVKCMCISCGKTYENLQRAPSCEEEICQCVHRRCSTIFNGVTFHVVKVAERMFKKKHLSSSNRLEEVLSKFLANNNIQLNDAIKEEFPKNWEVHGDLVLLPSQCLTGDVWRMMAVADWQDLLAVFGGKRLARSVGGIQRDGFRTPNVEMLVGDRGWVEHIDNGIRYSFDITKCMFSSGNITEKIRVANMKCAGETIVDLYAGIGYFTLPYLVHAKAAFVHACEWNPNAVEALKRNLVLNKVQDRCKVYEGDNRQTCPVGIADRVNLGLIPTSVEGWPVACKALKNIGGVLHIHENVTSPTSGKLSAIDLLDATNRFGIDAKTTRTGVSRGDNITSTTSAADALSNDAGETSAAETLPNYTGKASADALPIKTCEASDHAILTSSTSTSRIGLGSKSYRQQSWTNWSHEVSQQIRDLCIELKGGDWSTKVLHIEKVKSYAPHIDHIVVDLECRPL